METIGYGTNWVDTALWIWFALTAVSVAYVAWDLFTRTPEMKVMKWGWILVTLYTGVFGLIVYWFSCREPAPGTHEKFIAPLWKQAVGSTIHCMAGDATGIIVAAAITSFLGLPMGIDAVIEYFAGFALTVHLSSVVYERYAWRQLLGSGQKHVSSRMAFDERGDGGDDSGNDYPDDTRYAGDGADERQILGNYVARFACWCDVGLSGQLVACR